MFATVSKPGKLDYNADTNVLTINNWTFSCDMKQGELSQKDQVRAVLAYLMISALCKDADVDRVREISNFFEKLND